jgi:hypothetical protein
VSKIKRISGVDNLGGICLLQLQTARPVARNMCQRKHWPSVTNQHRDKEGEEKEACSNAPLGSVKLSFENIYQNIAFTPAKSVNTIIKTPVARETASYFSLTFTGEEEVTKDCQWEC